MTTKPGTAANQDPFIEIMENSGNSFHAKVATHFREAGWQVLVSPHYVDNATDKPREVDLICERMWIATQHWNTLPPKLLRIQLVVECKYIPVNSATIFWFDALDAAKIDEFIVNRLPFFKDNAGIQAHHYKLGAIFGAAKLFQSRTGNGMQNEVRDQSTWH